MRDRAIPAELCVIAESIRPVSRDVKTAALDGATSIPLAAIRNNADCPAGQPPLIDNIPARS
ncbi:hypothetical protein AOR01nite_15920 [Acetobacter orleanensis]|uniref:Uncharacterized protein n=1 Tax=Acetobacter orleanensis TaxID=104099 RepID=A0A4Y3TQQ1_9PROT|nr:hypothetical protein Abol_011_034 [Acetobacter orleanensis JCM 7639]GEB83115.1 hypothetical protein AOR01nite_15920 [Acetobacter orleanensis]